MFTWEKLKLSDKTISHAVQHNIYIYTIWSINKIILLTPYNMLFHKYYIYSVTNEFFICKNKINLSTLLNRSNFVGTDPSPHGKKLMQFITTIIYRSAERQIIIEYRDASNCCNSQCTFYGRVILVNIFNDNVSVYSSYTRYVYNINIIYVYGIKFIHITPKWSKGSQVKSF